MSETIEELKNAIKVASTQEGQALACTQEWLEGILTDFESLKAITELAVEGLRAVLSDAPPETDSYIVAKNTLSEIERLQNE